MTEYPYILFNKSPEQMRHLGACGGRAYGRNPPAAPSSRHRRKPCRPCDAQPAASLCLINEPAVHCLYGMRPTTLRETDKSSNWK